MCPLNVTPGRQNHSPGRSRWFDLFSGLHWGNAELDAMTRRGVIEQGRFSAAEIESGP
jgi:hypothetical protein